MANQDEYWLTTVDNPYDPFTEYQSWSAFDEQMGYFTNGLLARLTLDSNELPAEQNDNEVIDAMIHICELFPNLYIMVKKPK